MQKTLCAVSLLIVTGFLSSCVSNTSQSSGNESGWTPIFNGKDFSGFYIVSRGSKKNEDPNHLFQVHDGMIHMYKDAPDKSKQPFGYIITEKEFSNYHLRFQYK